MKGKRDLVSVIKNHKQQSQSRGDSRPAFERYLPYKNTMINYAKNDGHCPAQKNDGRYFQIEESNTECEKDQKSYGEELEDKELMEEIEREILEKSFRQQEGINQEIYSQEEEACHEEETRRNLEDDKWVNGQMHSKSIRLEQQLEDSIPVPKLAKKVTPRNDHNLKFGKRNPSNVQTDGVNSGKRNSKKSPRQIREPQQTVERIAPPERTRPHEVILPSQYKRSQNDILIEDNGYRESPAKKVKGQRNTVKQVKIKIKLMKPNLQIKRIVKPIKRRENKQRKYLVELFDGNKLILAEEEVRTFHKDSMINYLERTVEP